VRGRSNQVHVKSLVGAEDPGDVKGWGGSEGV
jgi:hypothetical protein